MIAFVQDPPAPPQPPTPPTPPTVPTQAPPLPAEPGTHGAPAQGRDPQWMINDKEVDQVKWEGGALQFTYTDGTTQAIPVRDAIPDGAVDIFQSLALMIVMLVVGRPISRAIARWIDRKSVVPHVSREVANRMQHMEHTLDDVAIQVERISEAQRFTSRLLAEEHPEAVPVSRTASR